MRRLFSRNAKLALSALPLAVGCALANQGDPPPPIVEPFAGAGGEETGGSTTTGGTATGGTGVSGSSSGTSGASTGGSTGGGTTGGSSGSATGGTSGKGGTAGTATGGTAGSMAGSAGKGGTAGTATGGTAGSMAGSAGTATGGSAGGPPGGMELFRDNFEMGAGNWTATPSGSWAIATDGSMVYAATGASASSTWRAAAAGEPSWTDVQIDARVKITSFAGMSTSYYAGICARYSSSSSYACFALRSQGQVSFRVNGNNTNSWNPPGGAITTGRWYTVRVIARGANITGFLDGTEIPTGSRVTSGAPASGRIALATPGTNAVFDDIVVTTP